MTIKLANNVTGFLNTAITASDTGIVLQSGNGASFPALGAGEYFYATLVSTGNTLEVVKVTARSGDSMTVVRAQDGTSAASFAAGSRVEMRINAQAVLDVVDQVTASQVGFTPVGGIAATDVQAALTELDSEAAKLTTLAASGGSALVGFLQAGAGAVTRTVQSKLRETVSVNDFGADDTGGTDSTTAVQNAINSLPNGGRVRFVGHIKFGTITFPTGKPYLLEIDGQITLTATLTIPSEVHLKGVGTGYSVFDQFGTYYVARINPPPGNVPTIRVVGAANHSIEHIQIYNCEGIGIELDGETNLGALCRIAYCSIYAKSGVATAAPIVAKTWFWLWIEHCSVYSFSGCLPYSIRFQQSNITSGGYTGLCYVKDCVINAHGISIQSSTNALSSYFVFESVVFQNCLNEGFVIENTGSSYLGQIKIDDFVLADSVVSPSYLIKTVGRYIREIRVTNCDSNFNLMNPSSVYVEGLKTENTRPFPYTFGINAHPSKAYLPNWNLNFSDAIDAQNIPSQLRPSTIPYTVLPVNQDVSTWVGESGGVVTTGRRAPDGTLTAAQIGGANGGLVRPYEASHSITVGDWVIGGVWCRSTDSTKPITRGLVLFTDGTVRLNDTPDAYSFFGTDIESARTNGGSWKWVPFALKVTNAGTGTSNIRLALYNDTAYGGTCEWWMPCMMLIPASAGIADFELARMSRSMTAFPATGEAGTVALLPYQLLQLGGGVRHYSASAAPASGTWKRGDVVWNTAPSAGGAPGWVCVTAGTPGTWKAMANLAA